MISKKEFFLLLAVFVLMFTQAFAAEDDIAATEAKIEKAMTEECRAFAADPQADHGSATRGWRGDG